MIVEYNATSNETSGVLKSAVKTTEFVEDSLFPLQFADTDMSGAKIHASMDVTLPGKWRDLSLRELGPALAIVIKDGSAFDGEDPINVSLGEDGVHYSSKPWNVSATVSNHDMLFTPPSSKSNRPKKDVMVNAAITLHCKPGNKQPFPAEAPTDA